MDASCQFVDTWPSRLRRALLWTLGLVAAVLIMWLAAALSAPGTASAATPASIVTGHAQESPVSSHIGDGDDDDGHDNDGRDDGRGDDGDGGEGRRDDISHRGSERPASESESASEDLGGDPADVAAVAEAAVVKSVADVAPALDKIVEEAFAIAESAEGPGPERIAERVLGDLPEVLARIEADDSEDVRSEPVPAEPARSEAAATGGDWPPAGVDPGEQVGTADVAAAAEAAVVKSVADAPAIDKIVKEALAVAEPASRLDGVEPTQITKQVSAGLDGVLGRLLPTNVSELADRAIGRWRTGEPGPQHPPIDMAALPMAPNGHGPRPPTSAPAAANQPATA